MTGTPWERLEKRAILENPYYTMSHDRYRRPDGEAADYYYVDIAGSTLIIPVHADGRLTLGRQYRYLFRRSGLELPKGGLPRGVDPLENARKELLEEAGLTAEKWEKIGEFAPYVGVSNECCHVFVAQNLREVGAQLEPTEEIEVVTATLEELQASIASGECWDGMTMAALQLYTQWLARA